MGKKAIVISILSAIYVTSIFWLVDVRDVASLLTHISPAWFLAACALVVIANTFTLLRSGSMLAAFGYQVDWHNLFLAFSAGNLTVQIFSVVGQSLSRAMVLERAGVPFGVSVIATYVERILAAGVLFGISIAGAIFLFHRFTIEWQHGIGDMLVSAIGIGIVSLIVAALVFRDQLRAGSATYLHMIGRLGPSTAWTILAHAAGLCAYLALFSSLEPKAVSTALVAALAIVMLATSLPISFAGFGLRELSAAGTLLLVGVPADVAVAAALTIGILYLCVAGLFGLVAVTLVGWRTSAPDAPTATASSSKPQVHVSDAIIIKALAIACAVFVFFRVRAPVSTHQDVLVNINAADLIIIMALTVIVLMMAVGRLRALFQSSITAVFAALSIVIAIGLMHAYLQDNLGGWALYTRGVGWVLIMGYAALGAALVKVAGDDGRMNVIRTMIVTALTICALQLAGVAVSSLIYPLPSYILYHPIQGFANNQNAFCFDLAIAGALLITIRNAGAFRQRPWVYSLALLTIAAAVFFSTSRTGAVLFGMLAIIDLALTRRSSDCATPSPWATAAVAIALAILIASAAWLGNSGLPEMTQARQEAMQRTMKSSLPIQEPTRFMHHDADAERWQTMKSGFELWQQHPLFGAGIGAYFESLRASGEIPKGIHSTYVWFLAEMGLAGFLVLMVSSFALFRHAWRGLGSKMTRSWSYAAIACLVLIGVGSLVQDLFFQRIFWFVLGLSIAVPGDASTRSDAVLLTTILGFAGTVFLLAI